MISYALKCDQGHQFESWFQSASAFDTLKSGGHLECAICGSGAVDKAIMAPRVTAARNKATPPTPSVPVPQTQPMAAGPTEDMPPEMRKALQAMKTHVEQNSDYVGEKFADEARAMHLGDAPERSIYGQANSEQAKALIEDGVPVLPLPFLPTKKAN